MGAKINVVENGKNVEIRENSLSFILNQFTVKYPRFQPYSHDIKKAEAFKKSFFSKVCVC